MRYELSALLQTEDGCREYSFIPEAEKADFGRESFHISCGKADLTLRMKAKKKLQIVLKCDVAMTIPCDRCLAEVRKQIPVRADREVDMDPGPVETETGDRAEYIEGSILDAYRLLREEILLNRPVRVLCSPDCKGICPVCGINRNNGACSCGTEKTDPRMAAIKDLFKNNKEV